MTLMRAEKERAEANGIAEDEAAGGWESEYEEEIV